MKFNALSRSRVCSWTIFFNHCFIYSGKMTIIAWVTFSIAGVVGGLILAAVGKKSWILQNHDLKIVFLIYLRLRRGVIINFIIFVYFKCNLFQGVIALVCFLNKRKRRHGHGHTEKKFTLRDSDSKSRAQTPGGKCEQFKNFRMWNWFISATEREKY